jgi:glycosyltransferase involved in cell wall biosynthesis
MDKMKISIITVVYNGQDYLENTIKSVINQTYSNIEYIIIDGGSTDRTLDIIKKYEDRIDYWVSEKDNGIYDAMNKGIDIATGEWINFMNAGDEFYDREVLKNIFSNNKFKNTDVIYGNHNVVYPHKTRIEKAGNIEDIWKGSQFSHQTAFVSAKILKANKFNLSNRIGADFEFFYTLYKKNKTFKYINVIVANYSAGGLSDIKRVDTIIGWWNVVEKDTKVNLYYMWMILKEISKKNLKKIIGVNHKNF